MHPLETPETSPTRSSPRLSIDLTNPPHSPFLHNLTQRLRKGSNASSHSGGLEAPAQPAPLPDPVKKTEKTREAKKLLAAMVRDDWEYPSTAVKENSNGMTLPYREPLGYRVREEWASDIEAEERKAAYAHANNANNGSASARGQGHGKGGGQHNSGNNPYRFESPDAVGDMVIERERKRRRLVEEEMGVNEGLRVWTNRRDAWTGAVKQRPRDAVAKRKESGLDRQRPGHIFRRSSSMLSHCHSHSFGHGRNTSTSTSSSSPLNPATSVTKSSTVNGDGTNTIGSAAATSTTMNANADANASFNTGVGAGTSAAIEVSSIESESIVVDNTLTLTPVLGSGPDSLDGPWLPIFPPLLPSDHDVLRDRITPKAYATIYSKIVVQGLAPNVPIPLVHMIPALVEGWKAEGNWPPQPMSISAADIKKGRRSSAFAKWRKEHHAHALDTRAADGQIAQHEREDGKGRVRRSISMMKRVLGGSDGRGGGAAAGLEELGIEFGEQDDAREMEKNVTLNKALLG
ncbi:hypothetical protein RBB50_012062 [Rhinocladiella similis]